MTPFPFRRPAVPARCPACRVPLVGFEWDGVELDRCPRCGGTWLDAGELETIERLAHGTVRLVIQPAGHGPAAGPCPRCRRRLRPASGADTAWSHPALSIPRCPAGHGLWVESGPLRELVEHFTEGSAAAVARHVLEICRAAPVPPRPA